MVMVESIDTDVKVQRHHMKKYIHLCNGADYGAVLLKALVVVSQKFSFH